MSQSIGIHLGERTFHLVAIDGGLRKHKVVCSESGDILGDEDAAEAVTERLKEIVKKNKLDVDNVHLSVDSAVAAFRNLTLPFDDREKIEEVIKFEIEGNLPQFDIDDVVVDFLTLSSKPGVESKLLVTAVPKERLGNAIELCQRAGLEPLEAELEGTALFDAALEGGVLEEGAGSLVIHVGDTSTTVVVADGHRLAGMRAIRLGARSHLVPEAAGETVEVDLAAPAAPSEEAPAAGLPEIADVPDDQRAAASVQRILRELVRTLSAARTTNEIRNVWVCGQEMPGLIGQEIEGLALEALPFEPGESPLGAEFVVAYGSALRGFQGGVLAPRLRREDLRFTGRFERLELPLAVFSLLLFTFLFVQYIVLDKQLDWRDEGDLAKDVRGDMQIWLEESNRSLLPDPTNVTRPVRLPDPPKALADYAANAEKGLDEMRTKYEEIQHVHRLLLDNIRSLERELGQDTDTKQPQSALTAATLVMNEIADMGKDVRVGIRRFEAAYQHNTRGDYVAVTLDVDFFGGNSLEATRNYNDLEAKFKSRSWCNSFEGKSTKSLDGDKGIQADGLTIQIDVDKALEAQS